MKTTIIPEELPILKVNNIVIYPMLVMPLVITDENVKKIIDHALNNNKLLGIFLTKKVGNKINKVGTLVSILKMIRNQEGSLSILLQGISRISYEKIIKENPFPLAKVVKLTELSTSTPKIKALQNISLDLMEKIIEQSNDLTRDMINGLKAIEQPARIADIIAGNSPLSVDSKQKILEAVDVEERFEILIKLLSKTIRELKVENSIRNNLELEMNSSQRKYFLLEQLDAIKKELGLSKDENDEELQWTKLINEAGLPEEAEKVAMTELDRMLMLSPESSEYNIIRTYLDWLVGLPWNKYSKERIDLKKIKAILDKDHYGLKRPKERILEFMAVKKLSNHLKGPILCFVGPPGVGKTSIGKSVARAINRKFIRLSLGGMHDESEIRGHRRTYIGAMPGKIINEIKKCGTANPVFMLDEIDKLGKDFRGDPSSALLEILDPEQNDTFMDNYLNVPYDLSDVLFITTANSLSPIPMALRDRMEIISFSSYLEQEKIKIAQQYLVPKVVKNNGLDGKIVKFMKSSLAEIIRYYVREAGVRNLQREIGTVARKVARKFVEGEDKLHIITHDNIVDYLGIRKYSQEIAKRKPEVGIVTGLAWTIYGGEILFCEVTKMHGKGQLILTGRLGQVMKESARIAVTYLKSNMERLHLHEEDFNLNDIHIHLPAGAVPKEGPSAGVTLTTALISMFLNKKVRHDVAMTGEITLLGKVLPIGGVKEKVLAAQRAGITEVILPIQNKEDFDDIEPELREKLKPYFVEKVDEIFDIVLE